MYQLLLATLLVSMNGLAKSLKGPSCLDGEYAKAKLVTHYYVPLLETYDDFTCDKMEGTCIFKKNGVEWLHNYGYNDQPLSQARCKNGYGNHQNCLHPCRALAAAQKYHPYGQVIFFPELVGMKCGNARDGLAMIHDGYMVVIDTGSPRHFNSLGRFDFFFGRCKNFNNGQCFEGATEISAALSSKNYCAVWDPRTPGRNRDLKSSFETKVRAEARTRKDPNAAGEFDLDEMTQN